jgi:triphosphoribosyl-dephospho-CoA synthase
MRICLKRIYYQCCYEELRILKPGNHSINSKILGMDHKKFELGAKISSEILSNKNLSLGESIYKSATECYKILRSNYNLGIILLCAPIFKIKNMHNFRYELNQIINNISENQGKLILNSIKEVSPAGIKKYSGEGSVNINNNISFRKIMKIGAKWDRISGCYNNNYSEIFSKGLPYLETSRKKLSFSDSISLVFLNYLSCDYDSHLLRKYGIEKASKIKVKASIIKKIKNRTKMAISMKKFDCYLKFFNLNPGTCADLTVTTLLISKIRDIFKFQI